MTKMMMKEVSADTFVKRCAEEFKGLKEMEIPKKFMFVKTGPHRKFPSHNPDWWYIRAASTLRRIYLDGPVGVSRLRTYYGGRKERGHKPERTVRAGGSIIRKILQQLETAELIEKGKNIKKGRVISEKGKVFVKKIIDEVKK